MSVCSFLTVCCFRCHLMHFNDNKYRFQSKRTKHTYDKGDVTQPCALSHLLAKK